MIRASLAANGSGCELRGAEGISPPTQRYFNRRCSVPQYSRARAGRGAEGRKEWPRRVSEDLSGRRTDGCAAEKRGTTRMPKARVTMNWTALGGVVVSSHGPPVCREPGGYSGAERCTLPFSHRDWPAVLGLHLALLCGGACLGQPNNGLSGLFSWINAYRRQIFLLNLSVRGLYGSFS